MLVVYDPESDVLQVDLRFFERLSSARQLDQRRVLHYDENGEVAAIDFLLASRGIDLANVPEPDRIADAIRAFRAATTEFAVTQTTA